MSPKPWLEWATTSPAIDSYIFQLLGPVVFGVLVVWIPIRYLLFWKWLEFLGVYLVWIPNHRTPNHQFTIWDLWKKMWFFTDSTMVNQHFSPPYFGIFLSFCPTTGNPKENPSHWLKYYIFDLSPHPVTVTNKRLERDSLLKMVHFILVVVMMASYVWKVDPNVPMISSPFAGDEIDEDAPRTARSCEAQLGQWFRGLLMSEGFSTRRTCTFRRFCRKHKDSPNDIMSV